MRPYPGELAEQERVFSTPIEAPERYTLACIALRNYLRQTNNQFYCPNSFADSEDSTGYIKEGDWRKIFTERNGALANLPNVHGSRYKDDAANMCCCLMRYLNREERVDW